MSDGLPSFLPLVTLGLLVGLPACDAGTPPGPAEPLLEAPVAEARRAAVPVPFEARAYTDLEALAPDPACGAPPRFLNTQAGEGEATHLGRFSVRFTFCVDATDILDDGRLTEGESLPYDQGRGVLVAANGDELYLEISGAVVPSDDPDFDFMFQDPFTFVGGTGRFAGAGGEGVTDSYVVQATDRTSHAWSGTLVLVPGR